MSSKRIGENIVIGPSVGVIEWPPEFNHSDNFAGPSKLSPLHATPLRNTVPLRVATTPPPLRPSSGRAPAEHLPAGQPQVGQPKTSTAALVAHRSNPAETDFLIETQLDEDDQPFNVPSIWQTPEPSPKRARKWDWSERSTAAFLGFAAGVLIIVPAVFVLSMSTDRSPIPKVSVPSVLKTASVTDVPGFTSRQPEAAAPAAPVIEANVVTVAATEIQNGVWRDSKPLPMKKVSTTSDQQARAKEAETRARDELAKGHITQARTILRTAASPDAPRLWFLLAETYDPRATSLSPKSHAQAASDELASADIKFARFYYQQALTHGIGEAGERLKSLPGQ